MEGMSYKRYSMNCRIKLHARNTLHTYMYTCNHYNEVMQEYCL